ncbi:hypothetical protein QO200_13235 [Flavobacterium sp. Arc3]|uniref:hypothetical protein n=1 Tax=Flavobacterium sp. Arc3 TaxID=3046686 RepID=UPI00352C7DC6
MSNMFRNVSPIYTVYFSKSNKSISSSNAENELFSFNSYFLTNEFVFDIMQYILVPLLLAVIITMVILLIANRFYFENKIQQKKDISNKTNNFLTQIIFSNYDAKSIKEKIKLFEKEVPFKKNWCKGLILNTILSFKRNVTEVNPHQMLMIYRYFGFQEYSRKLIKSSNWKNKLLAIYHYQILDYKIKTGYIRPYVHEKNKFLKSNALIAIISLSDQKLDFLSNYESKISNADQIKILDIIYQKKTVLPEKINEWLYNKNSSVVVLAIKLMIRYSKTLTNSEITYLFTSVDNEIRKETFELIRHLYIVDANTIVMNQYNQETEKSNKITALKTMAVIGDANTKDFALSLISKEKDLEIKFEIINCINKIDSTFFKTFKIDDPLENNIINRILLHVNNPYLN